MRLAALAAAIGGLAIASSSFGALVITTQRIEAGPQAGTDTVLLIVRESSGGALALGASALSMSVPTNPADTVSPGTPANSVANGIILAANTEEGGPDFTGGASTVALRSTPQGSFAFIPSSTQVYADDGTPDAADLRLQVFTPVSARTGALYTNASGQLVIGAAVVLDGAPVRFNGDISPTLELADATGFNIVDGGTNVPEPATLGALGLAALGLVRRRK